MNWMALIALILQILEALKKSESEEQFRALASEQVADGAYGARGDWIKLIWENREEILAFVLQLVELFKQQTPIGGESNDG